GMVLNDLVGRDRIVLRFAHLVAVGTEHHPVDQRFLPRFLVFERRRPKQGVKRPRPDDLVALLAELHRRKVLLGPPGGIQRRNRRIHPRVHHVGLADPLISTAVGTRLVGGFFGGFDREFVGLGDAPIATLPARPRRDRG